MKKSFDINKIAVIGSNSFSGSHFISFLLEKTNADVIGISRSPEKSALFLPYKKQDTSKFSFFQMDLNNDIDKMMNLFDGEKPEVIVNFAAQSEVGPSWENPEHWFRTNCLGIVNLASKLKTKKYLEQYVHISSPEVYGTCKGIVKENAPYNPSTPYAASKAAGDMFLHVLSKNSLLPLIMTRSTNVYGPYQQLFKIIPRTIIYIKQGKKIPLHGGGKAVKSYIHIRDICDGTLKIIEKGKKGEIYHFSPKSGYTVRNIVERICEKMGKNFKDVVEIVGERLGQDAKYEIDSSKARKELGWMPKITIDQGLDDVIAWINDNWNEIKKQPLEYIHKE
ncbi:TPA: GDP-mannose 4,6-dehydratase [archaeon]|uniref:GDP-mannose 4,6-dehydratase n=1 Tax=Candidatus Naiadarchaeum limnaeum TaxID=2756139 RepID=A0A832V1B5_9ARCH|nr:GDP-mannose 4,6-dehydratase [Candidatus Naiadarchaeales archaeon SRR2090153.bin1042]HIK00198.1 GDP-mannose 4,6-dehydratase [Candidatus Naiadarchaeum limnaeum]